MSAIESNARFSVTTNSQPVPSTFHAGPGQLARFATATTEDWAATMARVVLAVVIFPHGAQHLFGWFGGYGFVASYDWMTSVLGIPGPAAAFSIVSEFFAPLLLLA